MYIYLVPFGENVYRYVSPDPSSSNPSLPSSDPPDDDVYLNYDIGVTKRFSNRKHRR